MQPRKYGEADYTWSQLDVACRFCCSADGKDMVALASSPEHLLEICNVVLRLLAVSVVHALIIDEWSCHDGELNNAFALAYLIEHCQSLKVLSLTTLTIDEDHCRDLGAYSRLDFEIVLHCCTIMDAGANALAEVLGCNQGPTKLDRCRIDNVVLANGLRGNSRLNILKPRFSNNPDVSKREVLAIADALQENKGLDELNLMCYCIRVSDEMWGAICDSLKTHPTLQILNLRAMGWTDPLAPAVLQSRMQALVDMLKVSTIHTIHVDAHYNKHELFRESVNPYLETNRFRPRVRAIQKTRPIPHPAKVLGRALRAVRTDANCFWMLLSGNAEVAFLSRTTTIAAAAANIPASATAAATSTENVPSVPATASTAAASNVVAPAAGQRRKACP
jgi:hypothetical protein